MIDSKSYTIGITRLSPLQKNYHHYDKMHGKHNFILLFPAVYHGPFLTVNQSVANQ